MCKACLIKMGQTHSISPKGKTLDQWVEVVGTKFSVQLENFLFFYLIIYFSFWPHRIFLAMCWLIVGDQGYSLASVHRLPLTAGASCRGARALGAQAPAVVAHGLQSVRLVAVFHRLSCPAARGIFLDQGWKPCPVYWQNS